MTLIRSLLFLALAYIVTLGTMLLGVPIAILSRRGFSRFARGWARTPSSIRASDTSVRAHAREKREKPRRLTIATGMPISIVASVTV